MKYTGLTLIIALVLAAGACSKKPKPLATVGDKPVAQAEFDAYLELKHIDPANTQRRDKALDDYLERAGLAAVIEKEKLLDSQEVAAEVEEFKKELLISRYFDKYLTDKANEEAVNNYYSTHAADYEQKKAHVAHILFRANPKMSEEERKAKLSAAQEVRAKAAAGGDFAKLAEERSEDRLSGKKGGDLDWIKEGSIDPVFSQKAFSLKAGEISEVFETQFGFHVVKALDDPKAIKRPLETVAGDIRYKLRNEMKEAEIKRLKALVSIKKGEPYRLMEKDKAKKGPEAATQKPSDPKVMLRPPQAPTLTNTVGQVGQGAGEQTSDFRLQPSGQQASGSGQAPATQQAPGQQNRDSAEPQSPKPQAEPPKAQSPKPEAQSPKPEAPLAAPAPAAPAEGQNPY